MVQRDRKIHLLAIPLDVNGWICEASGWRGLQWVRTDGGSAHRIATPDVLSQASRAEMSFSRSHRNDRRRRVIRESIAADSDFAVESARAQRRSRRASMEDRAETFHTGYRDPGYSQAVRKTCQQRMVQLIPIRPGSLALVLTVMWTVWGLLLLAHYLFHVRASDTGRSTTLILQLFDVRSPHSIANWMTCQLWMLTAIVAWMIYRIRQHKLDDYRAKYRIWIVLACVALFSSFDTATSALYLFGQSIDGWTRKEIGYGGWPLVLACYASLIAITGLRLSSELKGTPTAVAFWFGGLVAWACAALLGTGLLKLDWSTGTIDLTVGACWLGGVLLVFQSAGMYLRYCYIQAQKRFVERAIAAPSNFKIGMPSMPRMPWSRSKSSAEETDGDEDADDDGEEAEDGVLDTIPKKTWLPWRRSGSSADLESADTRTGKSDAPKTASPPKEPKRPMRLFGIIPSRAEANESLVSEPIAEDEGGPTDTGLTKKSGWFGLGGNKSEDVQSRSTTTSTTPKTVSKPAAKPEPAKQDSKKDTKTEANPTKRGWIPSFGHSKKLADPTTSKPTVSSTKVSGASTSNTSTSPAKQHDSDTKAPKKSWFPFRKRTQATTEKTQSVEAKPSSSKSADRSDDKPKSAKLAASSDSKGTKRLASKIFGWLDGLKLKPPVDNSLPTRGASSASTSANGGHTGPKPIAASNTPFPSTSAKSTASQPTSNSSNQGEDDDDGSSDYRQLSKAERKRLRRQQGNDRYAA